MCNSYRHFIFIFTSSSLAVHGIHCYFSSYSPVAGSLPIPPTYFEMDEKKVELGQLRPEEVDASIGEVSEEFNASGHKQELERNFSLLSLCAIGITTGNVWAALGGSIVGYSFFGLQPRHANSSRPLRFTMAALQVSFMSSSQCQCATL